MPFNYSENVFIVPIGETTINRIYKNMPYNSIKGEIPLAFYNEGDVVAINIRGYDANSPAVLHSIGLTVGTIFANLSNQTINISNNTFTINYNGINVNDIILYTTGQLHGTGLIMNVSGSTATVHVLRPDTSTNISTTVNGATILIVRPSLKVHNDLNELNKILFKPSSNPGVTPGLLFYDTDNILKYYSGSNLILLSGGGEGGSSVPNPSAANQIPFSFDGSSWIPALLQAGTNIIINYDSVNNKVIINASGGDGSSVPIWFDAIVDGTNDPSATPPHYPTVSQAVNAGKKVILILGNITEDGNINIDTSSTYLFYLLGTWDVGGHSINLPNLSAEPTNHPFIIISSLSLFSGYIKLTSGTTPFINENYFNTSPLNAPFVIINNIIIENSANRKLAGDLDPVTAKGCFLIAKDLNYSFKADQPNMGIEGIALKIDNCLLSIDVLNSINISNLFTSWIMFLNNIKLFPSVSTQIGNTVNPIIHIQNVGFSQGVLSDVYIPTNPLNPNPLALDAGVTNVILNGVAF